MVFRLNKRPICRETTFDRCRSSPLFCLVLLQTEKNTSDRESKLVHLCVYKGLKGQKRQEGGKKMVFRLNKRPICLESTFDRCRSSHLICLVLLQTEKNTSHGASKLVHLRVYNGLNGQKRQEGWKKMVFRLNKRPICLESTFDRCRSSQLICLVLLQTEKNTSHGASKLVHLRVYNGLNGQKSQ